MQKLLVANYKMNGNKNFYQKVSKIINKQKLTDTLVLCPPFVYMPFLKIKNKNVAIGAQDICSVENGKSTGQINAQMFKEFNVKYTIVGHSERRANGESDALIAQKVNVAQGNDIIPIVCVGEKTKTAKLDVLTEQVKSALTLAENEEIVFAYEPVWAIGSGVQPTVEKINKAIKLVKDTANNLGFEVKVLYGGSVNSKNFQEVSKSNADGFLFGGVSNKIDEFITILKGE